MHVHDALLEHFRPHLSDLLINDVFAFAAQDLTHGLNIPMVIQGCGPIYTLPDVPTWIPRDHDATSPDIFIDSFSKVFKTRSCSQY